MIFFFRFLQIAQFPHLASASTRFVTDVRFSNRVQTKFSTDSRWRLFFFFWWRWTPFCCRTASGCDFSRWNRLNHWIWYLKLHLLSNVYIFRFNWQTKNNYSWSKCEKRKHSCFELHGEFKIDILGPYENWKWAIEHCKRVDEILQIFFANSIEFRQCYYSPLDWNSTNDKWKYEHTEHVIDDSTLNLYEIYVEQVWHKKLKKNTNDCGISKICHYQKYLRNEQVATWIGDACALMNIAMTLLFHLSFNLLEKWTKNT